MRKSSKVNADVDLGRPALSPEARDNQMISLAVNLAEKQLMEGTASSQVITHYLKLAATRERERIEKDIDNLKEDMEKVKSTVTVDTYEDIANLEDVQEGTIIYVKSDSNSDGSNVYVVESITSDNKVDVCTPISDFVKSTVPKLSYDASMPEGTKIYKSNSDDVIIRFKFTSDTYGDGKYKI